MPKAIWIFLFWAEMDLVSLRYSLWAKNFEKFCKKVDIFEICEVNTDSDFYHTIMKEKVLVA